jgi:phosphatidylserine/phosphatidylglycerophosphate/cardiolipin synthase-like enzyme
MDSFYKTVELAQAAGARVNIIWWFLRQASNSANQLAYTQQDMQNFAGTLIDLVKNHGLTAVSEITIQNEADSVTWLNNNKAMYNTAYRQLDSALRAAGIRSQIKWVWLLWNDAPNGRI